MKVTIDKAANTVTVVATLIRRASKSGDSILLASENGKTGDQHEGKDVKVNLNVYIPA